MAALGRRNGRKKQLCRSFLIVSRYIIVSATCSPKSYRIVVYGPRYTVRKTLILLVVFTLGPTPNTLNLEPETLNPKP